MSGFISTVRSFFSAPKAPAAPSVIALPTPVAPASAPSRSKSAASEKARIAARRRQQGGIGSLILTPPLGGNPLGGPPTLGS